MPARAERARSEHFAANPIVLLFEHEHLDDAVIDQHRIARGDVVDQTVVIHVDGIGLLALCPAHGELQNVARLQIQIRLQIARANRRALRVEQDRHRSADLRRDAADLRDDRAHPIMLRVAHVQPENVRALQHQLPKHFRRFRRRPERANDFRSTHSAQVSGYAGESKGVLVSTRGGKASSKPGRLRERLGL